MGRFCFYMYINHKASFAALKYLLLGLRYFQAHSKQLGRNPLKIGNIPHVPRGKSVALIVFFYLHLADYFDVKSL